MGNAKNKMPIVWRFLLGVAVGMLVLVIAGAVWFVSGKKAQKANDIMIAEGVLSSMQIPFASDEEALAKLKALKIVAFDIDTGAQIPNTFGLDASELSKDKNSIALDPKKDMLQLKRRENVSIAFIHEVDGKMDAVAFGIRGFGLWDYMYGFLALEGDLTTVRGINFYKENEVLGRRSRTDLDWVNSWRGKKLYGEQAKMLQVLTPKARKENIDGLSENQIVDAILGATVTSDAISEMLAFWFGEQYGYKKFIDNFSR